MCSIAKHTFYSVGVTVWEHLEVPKGGSILVFYLLMPENGIIYK